MGSQVPLFTSHHRAAIGLGSNLGDSLGILTQAIEMLDQTPGVTVDCHSRFYRTAPIGPPQPDYLNACALLTIELDPPALLTVLLEVERLFGRVRRERWGPRLLDLDLLLYDQQIIHTPPLQVPHPRMEERAFVLVPLAEIAPQWVDPRSGKTMAELVAIVGTSEGIVALPSV